MQPNVTLTDQMEFNQIVRILPLREILKSSHPDIFCHLIPVNAFLEAKFMFWHSLNFVII